jgi:hypothetical protein
MIMLKCHTRRLPALSRAEEISLEKKIIFKDLRSISFLFFQNPQHQVFNRSEEIYREYGLF